MAYADWQLTESKRPFHNSCHENLTKSFRSDIAAKLVLTD